MKLSSEVVLIMTIISPVRMRKTATARSTEGDSLERNSGWMDEGTNQELL